MTSIPRVIETHAEEAAFLWLLRSSAVAAPHYRLGQLVRLDTRVDAHLDGLRIAADLGWSVARAELAWKEAGEVFAAALLGFESDRMEGIEEILSVVRADPPLARGVISALSWLSPDRAKPWIERLSVHPDPACARIGFRAASIHGSSCGALFAQAASRREATLLAAGARAAGELADKSLLVECRRYSTREDDELRFWALWSLTLRGDGPSAAELRTIADGSSCYAPKAARPRSAFARRTGHRGLAW